MSGSVQVPIDWILGRPTVLPAACSARGYDAIEGANEVLRFNGRFELLRWWDGQRYRYRFADRVTGDIDEAKQWLVEYITSNARITAMTENGGQDGTRIHNGKGEAV